MELKLIELEHNRDRIVLLRSHIETYEGYFNWLLSVGILSSLIGLVFWSYSTRKKERLVSIELIEKESQLKEKTLSTPQKLQSNERKTEESAN